jgi:hypothetical protein
MGRPTIGSSQAWRLAAVALASLTFAPIQAVNVRAEGCPEVRIIFARGTFEAPGLGEVGDLHPSNV